MPFFAVLFFAEPFLAELFFAELFLADFLALPDAFLAEDFSRSLQASKP